MTLTARHRRPASPVWRGALVTAAWLAVVFAAPHQQPAALVHRVALFVHLGSVLVGFGAVLLVDWFGVRWVTGRCTFADVLRTAEGAHVPTWLGFAGLLASGLFLGPPAGPKMVAVLVVGLNGVYAGALLPRLVRHPAPPAALLVRSVLATAVSQAAWWTAVVAGFLTARG